MVKERSVVELVVNLLSNSASESTTEDFSDVVYGAMVYSSVDRANIKVAKALAALCECVSLENETALAQALVAKLSALAYLDQKANDEREKAKEARLAKKAVKTVEDLQLQQTLAKTIQCAHAVANDPEVKRTRRSRVKSGVFVETATVSCIPTSIAEVDVVKVKEVVAVRAAERITDTDDVIGAIGTAKQQDVFTEVEDLPKPVVDVNINDAMADFMKDKKAKLEALAALSQDKEPSL